MSRNKTLTTIDVAEALRMEPGLFMWYARKVFDFDEKDKIIVDDTEAWPLTKEQTARIITRIFWWISNDAMKNLSRKFK